MIACTYARVDSIKLESLIQLAKICLEIEDYDNSLKIFKKALQYAWKLKNHSS